MTGDSAGGQLAAALSVRWRREIIQKQKLHPVVAPLPPIRLQVLIYPNLQWVNMTTTSLLSKEDLLMHRSFVARVYALAAFQAKGRNPQLIRSLLENRHLTLASRARYAKFFYFGPEDGSIDEVTLNSLYRCS